MALLVSGCSSSSESSSSDTSSIDSSSVDSQLPVNMTGTNGDGEISDEGTDDEVANEMEDDATTNTTSAVDLSADGTDESAVESEIESIAESEETSTTRVDFEITVPAYSSEELQVRVLWGDIQKAASWVGDEYWTVSVDLPIDEERALVVTFYDRNGDVTLASYEGTFKTGFNSAESYQIFADQFDSDRWDTDADGVSNLDESILGGDAIQLELRDAFFSLPDYYPSFNFGTGLYEDDVTADRPYYEFLEIVPDKVPPEYGDETRTLTIDIDENGSGTLDNHRLRHGGSTGNYTIYQSTATRTNTGDGVVWEGKSSVNNMRELFETYLSSVELKRVNVDTLSAKGTYTEEFSGSSFNGSRLKVHVYSLAGKPKAESSACEPLSGTLLHAEFMWWMEREELYPWKVSKISKSVGSQFWTVAESTVWTEDDAFAISQNPESLTALSDNQDEIDGTHLTRNLGATFYCDYPELR